ncbi:DALR anticodon-binding domain-containing protein [Micromonospora sp. M12]
MRPDAPVVFAQPAERALAVELLGFAGVVDEVERSLEFHQLAGYLHRLAAVFNAFYERCPVLRATDELRESRLLLAELTARTLRQGCTCSASERWSGCDEPAGRPGQRVFFVARFRGGVSRSAICAIAAGTRR